MELLPVLSEILKINGKMFCQVCGGVCWEPPCLVSEAVTPHGEG